MNHSQPGADSTNIVYNFVITVNVISMCMYITERLHTYTLLLNDSWLDFKYNVPKLCIYISCFATENPNPTTTTTQTFRMICSRRWRKNPQKEFVENISRLKKSTFGTLPSRCMQRQRIYIHKDGDQDFCAFQLFDGKVSPALLHNTLLPLFCPSPKFRTTKCRHSNYGHLNADTF
jgi:hypothetical protein